MSSDESEGELEESPIDPQSPWAREFHLYLNTATSMPESMSIIQWWGVSIFYILVSYTTNLHSQLNAQQYPVWASLARDYLSIMATSVSSERAFSAGALTITKRRNRLKGDIVEAIQVLHMLYNCDLMFREPPPSSALELALEEPEVGEEVDSGVQGRTAWDLELSDIPSD